MQKTSSMVQAVPANRNPNRNVSQQNIDVVTCDKIDVDEIWNFFNTFGRYQLFQLLLLLFGGFPITSAVLSIVFVGQAVTPTCLPGNVSAGVHANGSVLRSACEAHARNSSESWACQDYDYGSETPLSFISEWHLVCEREALSKLPQMMTLMGMMIGAVTIPSFGDRFGRNKVQASCQFLLLVVMVGAAYVPVFELFLLLKCLAGILNQGFMVPWFTMQMELFQTRHRALFGFLVTVHWSLSMMCLVPIAYLFRQSNWRTMQLAFGLMYGTVLIYVWFVDESLRWLVVNKKAKEAQIIIKKACKMSKKKYEDLLDTILNSNQERPIYTPEGKVPEVQRFLEAPTLKTETKPKTNPSLLDMMRIPLLRNMSLIICFSWMNCSMTYYSLTFMSTSLFGDPYINFLIAAFLELLSGCFILVTLSRFGRKPTMIAFTATAGATLLGASLLATLAEKTSASLMSMTILAQAGRFCISAAFNAMWVYTPELYATNFRNIGVGISSSCSRLVSCAAPFLEILGKRYPWAPGALLASSCFLSAYLFIFLPETRWRELPDSIDDIIEWSRVDKAKKKGFFRTMKKPDTSQCSVQEKNEVA